MNEPAKFEEALGQLEEIVEKLQQSDLPLERAVALYRRGTELAAQTEEMLSSAELQVQELTRAVRDRFAQYSAVESGDSTEEEL
jgi:exodeoxyribonuclease VII small subunit